MNNKLKSLEILLCCSFQHDCYAYKFSNGLTGFEKSYNLTPLILLQLS